MFYVIHEVLMSRYSCMQELPGRMDVNQIYKIGIFSKRLGGRPITETTGIILVRVDGKYT